MGNSIAIIEVVGMATAIGVGDVAVKAANVELLGYELTRGAGLVVVKLRGDVGSVKAAVDAILGSIDPKTITYVVIPRPSEEVEKLLNLNKKLEIKEAEKKEPDNVKEEVLKIEIKEEEVIEVETKEKSTLSKEEMKQKEEKEVEKANKKSTKKDKK